MYEYSELMHLCAPHVYLWIDGDELSLGAGAELQSSAGTASALNHYATSIPAF